jgi:hypothetical protein
MVMCKSGSPKARGVSCCTWSIGDDFIAPRAKL